MTAESPWINERIRRREKARETIAGILGRSNEKLADGTRFAEVVGDRDPQQILLSLMVRGFGGKTAGVLTENDLRRDTLGDVLDQIT